MGGDGPDDHHQRRYPDLLHASRDKSCLRDSKIDLYIFFLIFRFGILVKVVRKNYFRETDAFFS